MSNTANNESGAYQDTVRLANARLSPWSVSSTSTPSSDAWCDRCAELDAQLEECRAIILHQSMQVIALQAQINGQFSASADAIKAAVDWVDQIFAGFGRQVTLAPAGKKR